MKIRQVTLLGRYFSTIKGIKKEWQAINKKKIKKISFIGKTNLGDKKYRIWYWSKR